MESGDHGLLLHLALISSSPSHIIQRIQNQSRGLETNQRHSPPINFSGLMCILNPIKTCYG